MLQNMEMLMIHQQNVGESQLYGIELFIFCTHSIGVIILVNLRMVFKINTLEYFY